MLCRLTVVIAPWQSESSLNGFGGGGGGGGRMPGGGGADGCHIKPNARLIGRLKG